jgi:molybdenum cofactor cytidylyltransferase
MQAVCRLHAGPEEQMRVRPTIIVLAAGAGSRYRGALHKLEEPLGGATVLGATLRNASQTQLPLLVVTTAARVALVARQVATRDILVVSDADAARGMADSIAAGVAERSGATGWLVLPGDMPQVMPGSMLAVATALEQYPVVYAQYRGRRGHPVGFSAELYSELVRLTGDDGARRVIARYPAHGVELDDPGVLLDVDTVADLAALRERLLRPKAQAAD